MKTNNIKSLLGAASLCATLAVPQLTNAAVTSPVGYVKIELAPEADTPFSLPMNRPMVYSGANSGISGNVISISDSDFTASEFIYVDGTQNEQYYVIFTTGALEGRRFDITANGANSITVDPDRNEDNTALETDVETLLNGASSNDNFEIRPHWTLATAFPSGADLPVTTDFGDVQGVIQTRELQIGINIPITGEYAYFDSTDDTLDGWYDAVSPSLQQRQDDVVLTSTDFYIFRNNSTVTYSPNIVGDVPTVDFSNSITTDLATNDNYTAISFPIELTLTESNLFESGAFKATTDFGDIDGDRLQVYEYPAVGYNRPILEEYVYFDSADDSFDGWYTAVNPSLNNKLDDVAVFQPGRGYIIRTLPRTADEKVWTTPMPYDPTAE